MKFQLKHIFISIFLLLLLLNEVIATLPLNNNYVTKINSGSALVPHPGKPSFHSKRSIDTDKSSSQPSKNCKRHLPLQLGPLQQQQEYTLVNMVLVTLLDGSIKGMTRNGKVHWTIKGGTGTSLVKSNIQYETKKFNKNTNKIFNDTTNNDDNKSSDFFDDTLENKEDNTDPSYIGSNSKSLIDPQDLEVSLIIEPENGGILYLFTQDEPLKKLPFSMKDIANDFFLTYDGAMFIGRKKTIIIAIDPRNGKIIKYIDPGKTRNMLDMMKDKQTFTGPLIYIGRNEYTADVVMNGVEWQLTYSEYVPNAMNMDIPLHMDKSNIYFAPLPADHALTAINRTDGEVIIGDIQFEHPVNMVFDVYTSPDYSITLSKQTPPKILNKGTIGSIMKNNAICYSSDSVASPSSAYVDVHQGTLYALSNDNYPLTQLTKKSLIYSDGNRKSIEAGENFRKQNYNKCEWLHRPFADVCSNLEYKVECLIGQHPIDLSFMSYNKQLQQQKLSSSQYWDDLAQQQSNTLPPPPQHWNDQQHQQHQQQNINYQSFPSKIYQPSSFFYDGPGRFWKLYIILLSILGYYYRKRAQEIYIYHILPKWALIMKYYHKHTTNNTQKNRSSDKKKSKNVKIKETNDTSHSNTNSTSSTTQSTTDNNNNNKNKNNNLTKETDTEISPRSSLSSSTKSKNQPMEINKIPLSSQSTVISNNNEHTNHSLGTLSTSPNVSLKYRGFDLQDFRPIKSTVLDISDTVLGYGSHGTVVYKGSFDGRAVAVKRLLIDFYDVALQEVKLLQESDDHPNVIRYFYKEETDRFLYIALELCIGSLHDCIERSLAQRTDMKLYDSMDPTQVLYQITSGIQHLHSLKIVHRDLKPQNILVALSKNSIVLPPSSTNNNMEQLNSIGKGHSPLRILISDFGLCKKLDGEQSSFHYTAASPAGTSGWRAPELLAGALAATSSLLTTSSTSSSSISDQHSSLSNSQLSQDGRIKATRSIDIFSAGCIFYYVLSNGDHPFGNRFGRETNILDGKYDLSTLESMGEDGMEAYDLIESMISTNPRARPSAGKILAHPFFWSTSKRLSFLQDASDRFEIEQRDPPSPLLIALESDSKGIIGYDWHRRIDRVVLNDLGKFRKYDGRRIRDLLRVLRNKKHHWQDLPDKVKQVLGEPPDQFLYYFTARFPKLLLHIYHVIANDKILVNETTLKQYF